MKQHFPRPRRIEANGIELAVHELGEGPPVILLHGFPELAFSWRYQLPALAAAGYRVIAPDQRGYGGSSKPQHVRDYTIQTLIRDVEGLMEALGLRDAAMIGHDWGALVLWQMSLTKPDRIAALINVTIPFYARPPVDPIALMRQRFGDDFYIVNFQDSDEADSTFAADVPRFFDVMMRRGRIRRDAFVKLPQERQVLSLLRAMRRVELDGEALLDEDEKTVYVDAFTAGGFAGPINWYRNWSHNWASTEGVPQTVRVPTLFIGAEDDLLVSPAHIEGMKPHVPDLAVRMIADCGHWTQQEKPAEVNEIVLEWLARRYPVSV